MSIERIYEHVAITVGDLDRSIRFYCDVLDYRLLRATPVNAYLYSGEDDLLELMQSTQPEQLDAPSSEEGWIARLFGPVGLNHLGFRVDDLDATVRTLRERGARMVAPPREIVPEVRHLATVSADKLRRAGAPPEGQAWRVAMFVDPDGIVLEFIER